ncbi:Nitrogen assimilation transcription factor [Lachnellula willkommii]|uniref:Nitrogen assimilation transcription factor n=1 Tax=Lachnellula willkommii TaxID=215461 RepID=A0A559MAX0_9HELO|nr:Nitrogen assimilation transcription factor [Lachnellula willkommii]
MFDGEHRLERKNVDSIAVVDTPQRAQLLAESARQRQLELINLRSGKLNFDGLDPELGMRLLSVFWNRQHATGSIVYRPCFMRDMASKGPHFSPLLLNAIFFVASKHVASKGGSRLEGSCSESDNCNSGLQFRGKINNILHDPETQVLCKSSITTIQALLIMSDALFSWCDERSLSWHYLGIAINMIIDLGIHSEKSSLMVSKSHSPEKMETHRRLFWAAFVLDKIQAIYQGRPARLRDIDNSVPMVFLDDYEELEPFDTLGYSAIPGGIGLPTHSVSTFEHLCKLSTIADRILYSLYTEKSSQMDSEELFRTSQILHADLARWRESLPAHLSIDFDTSGSPNTSSGCVVLPHTLSLISMFHALLILLHRPFVSSGHLKSAAAPATSNAISICETAASDIDELLRCYKAQWCIKSPPYFISYSTYVSATIHVRTSAQKPPGSKAHQRLRNCLEILSEHQVVCHAPRRAMSILLGLVRRLKVDVGGAFTASVSRTAECEETSCVNTRSSLLESPSDTMLATKHTAPEIATVTRSSTFTSQDPIQPPTARTESDEVASAPAPVDSHWFSQLDPASHPISYGLDEMLPDMSFDFDPLFGFNDFDMDLELGF